MQSGFNTNIRYRGVLFHVQTEDSGKANPHVITHLFHGGNIMASEKVEYAQELGRDDLTDAVRELMEAQHKKMLMRLKRGDCDAPIMERLGEDVFRDQSDTAAQTLPPEEPCTETVSAIHDPRPPAAPKPAGRSFGDSVAAKPLDEMVLDYLVENARKRKRSAS